MGLAHDRLVELGMRFIDRGMITKDEYEDYVKYLYLPYKDMGGNGTAERIKNAVDALPICNDIYAMTPKERKHLVQQHCVSPIHPFDAVPPPK